MRLRREGLHILNAEVSSVGVIDDRELILADASEPDHVLIERARLRAVDRGEKCDELLRWRRPWQ